MKGYASKEMRRFNYLIAETDAAYHDVALKLGLSDSVLQILYTVCDYAGGEACPLQEICRRTGISKQTINSALRRLEAEGMAYLEQTGARGKHLCLTQKGKELAGRTVVKLIEAENDILSSWPQEDVEKYLELTEKFLRALREKTENVAAPSRAPK